VSEWDAEQYLKFQKQRTQPAIDLANRVKQYCPKRIVDIGCGPGNSTAVLHETFPTAMLVGIDNSHSMLEKAKRNYPNLCFAHCDVKDIDSGYDLLFSNACLQWVPDHARLLPDLMGKLNTGGVLAAQLPINGAEPLYRIIAEVTAQPMWGLQNGEKEVNEALSSDEYFDILSVCSCNFSLWETVYYHNMPTHQALLEWVRGTRLRPYLAKMDKASAAAFEKVILDRVMQIYPIRRNGEIVLRFRRLFFIAEK